MKKREKQVFNDLMDMYEFRVSKNKNGSLSLEDLQSANLGGICDVSYRNEWEILDRMEMYHDDYIIRVIQDEYDVNFNTYQEYADFLEKENYKENSYTIEILKLFIKGGK